MNENNVETTIHPIIVEQRLFQQQAVLFSCSAGGSVQLGGEQAALSSSLLLHAEEPTSQ